MEWTPRSSAATVPEPGARAAALSLSSLNSSSNVFTGAESASNDPRGSSGFHLPDRVEQHDRNFPVGLRLVFLVRRPDLHHLRPQPGPLVGRGDPGPRLEDVAVDLYPHARIGDQVLEPQRVRRDTALGRHHDVAVAVAAVDQPGPTG